MNLWIGARHTTASELVLRLEEVDGARAARTPELLRTVAEFAGLEDVEVDGTILNCREVTLRVALGPQVHVHVAEQAGGSALVVALEALLVALEPLIVHLDAPDLPDEADAPGFPYPARAGAFLRSVHRERSRFASIEVCIHPVFGRVLLVDGETHLAASDAAQAATALVGRSLEGVRTAALLGGALATVAPVVQDGGAERVTIVEQDHVLVRALEKFFPEAAALRRGGRAVRLELDRPDAWIREHGEHDLVAIDLSGRELAESGRFGILGAVTGGLGVDGRLVLRVAPEADTASFDATVTELQRRFQEVRTWTVALPSLRERWVFAEGRGPRHLGVG